jgi:hypothetical protein
MARLGSYASNQDQAIILLQRRNREFKYTVLTMKSGVTEQANMLMHPRTSLAIVAVHHTVILGLRVARSVSGLHSQNGSVFMILVYTVRCQSL